MMSQPPSRSYGLVELFDSFRSPVRSDHDYFVASPPAALALDRVQLQALEVREPFFVDRGWSVGPNRDVVPFVWDPKSGGQPRFSEAEAFTDYDSGHFGLAAVSAPTGQAQAQLYAVLAQGIVEVHRANRSLLDEWFAGQGPASQEIFVYFDRQRRTAEEKLLTADGSIDRTMWDARLEELAASIQQRTFLKHHFRWVEFLAHAVDVPQLMGLIKAAPGSARRSGE
jgi:hypothetical protein